MLEVEADPDERASRVERLAEHLEQSGAFLEQLEQSLVGIELVAAGTFEQPGGAADVEALPVFEQLGEGRPERREKRRLSPRQARVLELLPQLVRARLKAGQRVVEVLARPVREAGI